MSYATIAAFVETDVPRQPLASQFVFFQKVIVCPFEGGMSAAIFFL